MSIWIRAQISVNSVVIAPSEIISVWEVLLISFNRLVGRYLLQILYLKIDGCRAFCGWVKSCVKGTLDDLANCGRSLINGRLIWLRLTIKFCWKSNEIRLNRNPATDKMNPLSSRWRCWKFDYFRFLIEAFYSVPLIYLSSLSPTLHFLDCCTFIIGFEVGLCQSSNFSFSIVFWAIAFCIHYKIILLISA